MLLKGPSECEVYLRHFAPLGASVFRALALFCPSPHKAMLPQRQKVDISVSR